MTTLHLLRTKIQATTIFSGGAIRDLAGRDQLWILPLALLGVLVGLGGFVFVLVGNYQALLVLGVQAGRPGMLFSFSLLASWALILLLGTAVVLSVFFFSKDTPLLLALPIRPSSIVTANAALVYLSALVTHLVVMVPALVVYLSALPTGLWFWVCAVVLCLAGPVVPLGLAMLAAFLLTALVNPTRFRVALEVLGFTVFLGSIIAFQVVLQRSAMSRMGQGPALPTAVALRLMGVVSAFPPLDWLSRGFLPKDGALYLALFAGLNVGLGAVVLFAASRTYLKLTVERALTRAARISRARYRRLGQARGVVRALVGREIAVLTSSSSLLFEAVVEALVFPLILGIFSITLPAELRGPVTGFLERSPWSGLVVMAVLLLMAGFNTVSSTSISREGRVFALSLMLPVSGRMHVRAKLVFHAVLLGVGYLINLAIVLAVLRLPVYTLVYLAPGGAGFIVLSFCFCLFLDLRRPFLTWTHPQQAMKQNMNALAAMGVTLLVVAVHAAVGAGLALLGAPSVVVGLGVAAVSLVGASVALPALDRYADRMYGGRLEALTRA